RQKAATFGLNLNIQQCAILYKPQVRNTVEGVSFWQRLISFKQSSQIFLKHNIYFLLRSIAQGIEQFSFVVIIYLLGFLQVVEGCISVCFSLIEQRQKQSPFIILLLTHGQDLALGERIDNG